MIVGSGLIARAFASRASDFAASACIYAAGVSNSGCQDDREFERERRLLTQALDRADPAWTFVYFSTCSVEDPFAQASPYVRHKRVMELAVTQHSNHLVIRLPQLAGITPNPHTILNYLFSKIVRSERFELWQGSLRNIIDVDDVVEVVCDLLNVEHARQETINVANHFSTAMSAIVAVMEDVLGRKAVFDVIEQGSSYIIDTNRVRASLQRCGIGFPADYLHTVVAKYYGRYACEPFPRPERDSTILRRPIFRRRAPGPSPRV